MATDLKRDDRSDALSWLARLPFLPAHQLAILLGCPRPDVESVVRDLGHTGWIDWIELSSSEIASDRLHVLSASAWRWLTERGEHSDLDLGVLPCEWADTIRRLSSIELTTALNGFASILVTAARLDDRLQGADIRALPLGRRADQSWPPKTQARVSFLGRGGLASAFVIMARPAVPAGHRDTVVANWYRYRELRKSAAPLPFDPILVVCADEPTRAAWAHAVRSAAERRGVATLPVYPTRASDIGHDLLVAPVWHHASGAGPAPLFDLLFWRQVSATTPSVSPARWFEGSPAELTGGQGLYRWAKSVGAFEGPAPRARGSVEQVAALSIAMTADQKRMLEVAGRYPLLSESELALVLRQRVWTVRRSLERSIAQGLIEAVVGPVTKGLTRSDVRYVMTELGLRLVAARERIPARRYAEHGPFAATIGAGERGRLQTLIRQFEHTVGANRFFLDCLAQSEAGGPSLREWQSVSETTIRFESNGVRRTIRPDGTGRIVHNGIERRFWLEWDRGTERIAVLLEKLDRYAAYFRSHTVPDGSVPHLLMVCPTPHREDVVWRAAGAIFASDHTRCHLKTTSEPLLERRGPFGTVWRAAIPTGRISLME
jgi:hypothetical protein